MKALLNSLWNEPWIPAPLYWIIIAAIIFGSFGCSARGGQAVAEGLQEYSRQMQQNRPRNCFTNFVGNMAFTNCY